MLSLGKHGKGYTRYPYYFLHLSINFQWSQNKMNNYFSIKLGKHSRQVASCDQKCIGLESIMELVQAGNCCQMETETAHVNKWLNDVTGHPQRQELCLLLVNPPILVQRLEVSLICDSPPGIYWCQGSHWFRRWYVLMERSSFSHINLDSILASVT